MDNQQLFLATTALEEFWDTSKKMVFLNPGCLRYSRKYVWEKLDYIVAETYWDDRNKIKDAYLYINEMYEPALAGLTVLLNRVHGTSHDSRFWRIVIGGWLYRFISVVYERYVSVKSVIDQYPTIRTIGLDQESYLTNGTPYDFLLNQSIDINNIQLYSRILSFIGCEIQFQNVQETNQAEWKKGSSFSFNNLISHMINRVIALPWQRPADTVALIEPYFGYVQELKLWMRSGGRIRPINRNTVMFDDIKPDPQKREMMKKEFQLDGGELERLCAEMIIAEMPLCYLEGFEKLRTEAKRNYDLVPKLIFSANSWHGDPVFCYWAASCAEKGTLLLGTQHGGDYGVNAYMMIEDHELSVVDRYFSWGWDRAGQQSKIVPMPAAKLVGRKPIGASNKRSGILMTTVCESRVFRLFDCDLDFMPEFLSWHFRFLQALSPAAKQVIGVRPKLPDRGWDYLEQIRDICPEINVESMEMRFEDRLEQCRLFVCDHPSTTYLEALAINKPTILFWNPNSKTAYARPEAQLYFDDLRRVGILYDTPEAAAEAVSRVYNDVENWWNGFELQTVRERFCDRFARTSSNSSSDWLAELKQTLLTGSNETFRE